MRLQLRPSYETKKINNTVITKIWDAQSRKRVDKMAAERDD